MVSLSRSGYWLLTLVVVFQPPQSYYCGYLSCWICHNTCASQDFIATMLCCPWLYRGFLSASTRDMIFFLLMAMLFVHSTWQHVGWELLYMLGFMLDYSRGWQSPRLFRYMALVWFIVMLLMLPRTSLGRTSTSRRWWRRLTAPGGSLLK